MISRSEIKFIIDEVDSETGPYKSFAVTKDKKVYKIPLLSMRNIGDEICGTYIGDIQTLELGEVKPSTCEVVGVMNIAIYNINGNDFKLIYLGCEGYDELPKIATEVLNLSKK